MALKPGKLFYNITEVAAHFDVAPSLLRYWESEFPKIKPRRNARGTRSYTSKDIEIIKQIHLLVKEKGYTLQGAKVHLKNHKGSADRSVIVINKLENIKLYLTRLHSDLW